MGIEISDIAAILKKVIHPVVHDQLRKDNIVYQKVKRNVGVSIANNQIYIAMRVGRHSGVYTVAEGAEPRAGKSKYAQPCTSMKYAFGTLELTDQALTAAKGKDEKAIAGILQQEIEGLKDDLGMDLNRQFHGAGAGRLCLANGVGTNTTALTVDGNVAGLDGTEYLAEGMFITIGSAQAVEIASVDSATAVTLAEARTWADDAVITKENADEMMGFSGLIDDGDNAATIQNITRASSPYAVSFVDDTTEALTEEDMVALYLKTRRYGGADAILVGEALYAAYGALLLATKKTYNTKEVLTGGWMGLEFAAGGGGVGIILDPDTWSGYVQMVNFKAFTLAEMSEPFAWLEADQHGGILKRSASNRTVWEGTLKYYANLVCLHFKRSARMRGKS